MRRLALPLLLLISASLAASSPAPIARSASLSGSLAQGWAMATLPSSAMAVPGPKLGAAVVVRGGPGFVALGQYFNGSPPLWESPDGRSWQVVPQDARVFHPGDVVTSLAAARGMVLALGTHQSPQPTSSPLPPRVTTVVWTSRDGRTWRRADAGAFTNARMMSVTAGGPGFVGVGSTDLPQTVINVPPPSPNVLVWTSTDGITWQRVAGSGPSFYEARMTRVLNLGSRLVALGSTAVISGPDAAAPPPPRALVWTSSNGRSWRAVTLDRTVFPDNAEIDNAVVSGGALLAWGTNVRSEALRQLLWRSPDGVEWHAVTGQPFQNGFARAIAAYRAGFVAVGRYDDEPTLWASPDGVTWTRAAGEDVFGGGETQLSDVVSWQDGLLVVGTYDHPDYLTQGIPTPSLAEAAAWRWQPQATGSQPTRWSRTDPKWFRLRIADLPPGFQPFAGSGAGGYGLGCALEDLIVRRAALTFQQIPSACGKVLGALGRFIPYTSRFPYGPRPDLNAPYVAQYAILAESEAMTRAAMRYAGGLVVALDLNENRTPPRLLPDRPHIGQTAKVYVEQTARSGTAYGVVWRDGRAMGAIEVVRVPGDRKALAIALAEAQWRRWVPLR